ncbi:SDR family NAD(P)-dependent oxidoreductase [Promicromonospora sp. NPDC052451]|uniref:SDR family NAD(P)-dependent oxidoreductase n=1 Tax=Promicromonospora sp. NPDC052451 TaxID=3364407 RepID=UPI0037C7CAEF
MQITIVVGASSGIGRATAVRAAQGGAGVVVTYNSNAEGARETVRLVEEVGGTAVALPLDVGDSATFGAFRAAVVEAVAATWGERQVTGLVNNAGFGGGTPFAQLSEELLDRTYRVLFKGPYLLTQTLLPLIADGGAIVNTASSSAGTAGLSEGYSAYGSMKGAVVVLSRYLAKELSGRGIRVNSVSPGPTRTRLGGDAFEKYPEVIPPLVERTALGRLGEPDDVGAVIAFLLSDAARWVTAQDIEVSGGFNL